MKTARWILNFLAFNAAGVWAQQTAPNDGSYHQIPDSDGSYFVGYEVTAPTLTHAAPATYPGDTARPGLQGICVLFLVVAADGAPATIRTVQGLRDDFDAAAIDSVRRSQFEPGKLNGKPVPVKVWAEIGFSVDHRTSFPELVVMERDVSPVDSIQGSAGKAHAADPANSPPVLIHMAEAYIPVPGKKAKYQSLVSVSALVGVDGLPSDVRVVRPLGMGLDEKAVEAVRLYRFKPALKRGMPVPAMVSVEVKFLLW
jgi:outer membrane biosynthesis protein TonB